MYYAYTKDDFKQIEKNLDAVVDYLMKTYSTRIDYYLRYEFCDNDYNCCIYINKDCVSLTVGYSSYTLSRTEENFGEERRRLVAGTHVLRNWARIKEGLDNECRKMDRERFAITYGFEV